MSRVKRRTFLQSLGASASVPLVGGSGDPFVRAQDSGAPNALRSSPRFRRDHEAITITNLGLAKPAEALSRKRTRRQWHLLDYEAEDLRGTLIYACEEADPLPELTLPLNASGWHAIYLGFYCGFPGMGGAKVKLSRDATFRRFLPQFTKDISRVPVDVGVEHVQEGFWKCADLTGQSLHIKKTGKSSNLSHVRLVPLNEEETAAFLNARQTRKWELIAVSNVYMDNMEEGTPEEVRAEIELYRHTDFSKLIWVNDGIDPVLYPSRVAGLFGEGVEVFPLAGERKAAEVARKFIARGINLVKEAIDYGHSLGLEVHSGIRLYGLQSTPPREELYTARLYREHPELRCLNRDGRPVARLSFAFEPVQKYFRALVNELLDFGADGVTLLFTRGVPVMLYEEPLSRGFHARFGRDPKSLPREDSQWLDYLGEQVTRWLRGVRQTVEAKARALGKPKLQLSCYALGNAQQNRFYGLDIHTWAKEGITDFLISRGDFFIPNVGQSGNYDPAVVTKYFSAAVRGTRCKFYFDPIKARIMPANEYREIARQAFSYGADGLAFWNMEGRYHQLDMFATLCRLGHEEELKRSTSPQVRLVQSCGGVPANPYPTMWGIG